MMTNVEFALANYATALEWGVVLMSLIILVSSLDDLFIDCWYWSREIYRKTYIRFRYKPIDLKALMVPAEGHIAIMVPAWQEYAVIAEMIEYNVATLEYSKFKIFCGTYPNDHKTVEIVDAIARRYKHVVHVRVPHDGPTCKADCLNWIIQAIFLHEDQHNMEFTGIVVHDSEDVIHPLELKLFNFLLPKKDFIQLPVLSLERPWWSMVAGTYLDDFAEWHSKDLVVRESMIGEVPSAGVGTCFSRRAIKALAAQKNNQPFNTDSLTEDYDFSFRLSDLGMKQIFVRIPIRYVSKQRSVWTGKEYEVEMESVIAVREYFPESFRAAYRQRARWIFGIAFQGWLEVGWRGSWATRYMLLRDRKGVVTSFVTIVAYVLMFNIIGVNIYSRVFDVQLFSGLIASHPWMQTITAITIFLLCNRIGQRVYFVSATYGPMHAIASIPRMVVNNVINFFAASRAWRLFFTHAFLGRSIAWDKTDHAYPSLACLKENRRRLGDLLVSWKNISSEQLATAILEQGKLNDRLGKVLLRQGWIDDCALAEALAYQNDLPRAEYDPKAVVVARDQLPIDLVVRHGVLPAGVEANGEIRILSASPLNESVLENIQRASGRKPVVAIIRESEAAHGLRLLLAAPGTIDVVVTPKPLLGDILVELGFCYRQGLNDALKNYSIAQHGRLGDFLVDIGLLDQSRLDQALLRQSLAAA